MTRPALPSPATLALICAAVTACGGNSSSGLTAGASGSSTAGSSGSGGSNQGGGTSGGGVAGASGAAPVCDPPADASKSSLCVTFQPDDVDFEFDPGFDGLGQFVVQVYDYPDPPDNASDYIAQALVPDPNGGGVGAIAVTELPVVRFDDLPPRVYVKSIFLDNPLLDGGVWIGGYDLSGGFVTGLPLTAIDLTPGSAGSVDQHLWATRQVRVAMRLATGVAPDDDGIGPAGIGLYDSSTPTSTDAAFGFGSAPCVDVSGGNTAVVGAVLVGTGDFWISAAVNDFNQPDVWSAGSIVSLAGTQLPSANRIHISTQYRVQQAIQLTTVLPTGAPPPQPYTCAP